MENELMAYLYHGYMDNYRKTYDPATMDVLKYSVSEQFVSCITEAMENWRQRIAEIKIQRDLYQRHSLSQLQFVIALITLNYILRKCNGGHKFTKSQENIFTKNEKE